MNDGPREPGQLAYNFDIRNPAEGRIVAERGRSSRETTQKSGRFTRDTPGSQALERGLLILRTFKGGTGALTNAELAARTGVPRPTISRLTRSLVDLGFLTYDLEHKAYRLGPAVLSLAQSYRQQMPSISAIVPLMRKVAEGGQLNVGIAIADQMEMVYLESVRESRRGIFRRLSTGSRIPMELTSLGRAYLAALSPAHRKELLARLASQHARDVWSGIEGEIEQAIRQVQLRGYCHAVWQPGMVALAAPCISSDRTVYAINISFPWTSGDYLPTVERYGEKLIALTKSAERVLGSPP